MDHWDEVLPGRVTHVRYEDMVSDMPGISRAILSSPPLSLPWNDDVLNFHQRKHSGVNTHSTIQVRKGMNKDGMGGWKRYDTYLEPLRKAVGKKRRHQFQTTVKGYTPISSQ